MMGPPSRPFFSGAVNLKNLTLRMRGKKSLFLNHFVFPNLKTFELSVTPHNQPFYLSGLLDFLEASPTLQTIRIRITTGMFLPGDTPPERVVVLPNVETFSLTLDKPYCWIAPHVSCSSARSMSFVHEQDAAYEIPQEIFPTPNSWNVICPQNTIDEVVLGMTSLATTTGEEILFCSLSLSSPGLASLELGCKRITEYEACCMSPDSLANMHYKVFSRAFGAVRKHPLLNTIKRLRIRDTHTHLPLYHSAHIANEAARLFESTTGPLEELIIEVDNPRPFIPPFFNPSEPQVFSQPYTFPSIKGFTIAEHSERPFDEECVAAIAGFVKSQFTRGVPFERVVFHMESPPTGMAERLEQWVSAVHFPEVALGGNFISAPVLVYVVGRGDENIDNKYYVWTVNSFSKQPRCTTMNGENPKPVDGGLQ